MSKILRKEANMTLAEVISFVKCDTMRCRRFDDNPMEAA